MPDRITLMIEHSMRREQDLTNIVEIYQKALGVIAQNMALNPVIVATQALRSSLPIMAAMQTDPWPPLGVQNKSAD